MVGVSLLWSSRSHVWKLSMPSFSLLSAWNHWVFGALPTLAKLVGLYTFLWGNFTSYSLTALKLVSARSLMKALRVGTIWLVVWVRWACAWLRTVRLYQDLTSATDEYSSLPLSLFFYQRTDASSWVPRWVIVQVEPSSSNGKPMRSSPVSLWVREVRANLPKYAITVA